MELSQVLGKTMDETKSMNWIDYWPIINESGVITGLVDAHGEDCHLPTVDWRNGQAVPTDPDYGFDAYLER